MDNEFIVTVRPRGFLLPIINDEIKQLLRYLTRDDSWKGSFSIQVEVDGIVAKLKRVDFGKG